MSTKDEGCHSDEYRASLTRLPELAEPTIQFNVAKELEQLHQAGAWDQASGRSSKTLAKYEDFRIVLVSMKADTRMDQHKAEGRISIQCLEGRLRIHLPDSRKAEVAVGDVLVLDCGIPHDVEALVESAFLLTICWPNSHAAKAK
jgi:quercetin dioxygenase-like cupin family protein